MVHARHPESIDCFLRLQGNQFSGDCRYYASGQRAPPTLAVVALGLQDASLTVRMQALAYAVWVSARPKSRNDMNDRVSDMMRHSHDPDRDGDTCSAKPMIRAIAFHLPQFHPIPENDEWWGKGFTEWTNVVKARPLFPGHHQPHLPADLGFYDLRLPEARAAQAELAASYGIRGFCYYHYWFNGRRLLGRPLDEILSSGRPDFPFCLCWANESWTRGWLGQDQNVLISQNYTADDESIHAQWLANAFADRRYLRKDGRAIFLVYRPGNLPEPKRLVEIIRTACNKNGDRDPYLIAVDAHHVGRDFRDDGFDVTLAFEPQLGALPGAFDDAFSLRKAWRNLRVGVMSAKLKVYDYTEARQRMLSLPRPFPTIPCVFVGWDNTPRRGRNGLIMVNSSPQAFRNALEAEVAKLRPSSDGDPILFINAWNEWAEGNHLEPCQKWCSQHLEVVREALGMVTESQRPHRYP